MTSRSAGTPRMSAARSQVARRSPYAPSALPWCTRVSTTSRRRPSLAGSNGTCSTRERADVEEQGVPARCSAATPSGPSSRSVRRRTGSPCVCEIRASSLRSSPSRAGRSAASGDRALERVRGGEPAARAAPGRRRGRRAAGYVDARLGASPRSRRRRTPPSRPAARAPGRRRTTDTSRRWLLHGPHPQHAVVPARDGDARACGDGERQHEAVVVVGVLADQVDPARSATTTPSGARSYVARTSLDLSRRRHRRQRSRSDRRSLLGRDVVDEGAHAGLRAGQVLELVAAARGSRTARRCR